MNDTPVVVSWKEAYTIHIAGQYLAAPNRIDRVAFYNFLLYLSPPILSVLWSLSPSITFSFSLLTNLRSLWMRLIRLVENCAALHPSLPNRVPPSFSSIHARRKKNCPSKSSPIRPTPPWIFAFRRKFCWSNNNNKAFKTRGFISYEIRLYSTLNTNALYILYA